MSSTPDPSAPPHAYICPITSSLMVDPVIDPEGNSYERSAITEWLGRSGGWGSSPVTRRRLGVSQLAPNRALQEAIEEWTRLNSGQQMDVDDDSVPRARTVTLTTTSPSNELFVPDTTLNLSATVSSMPTILPSDLLSSPTTKLLQITVTAPLDTPRRTPVDLVCVVDISGSMGSDATVNTGTSTESSGLTVLDIVKHALNTMAHSLDAQDRMAIISFSDTARTELPLTRMDDAGIEVASSKIGLLRTEGSTNIHGGLTMALDLLLAAGRTRSPSTGNPFRLPCIALLTDGQPNVEPPRGTLPTLLRRAKNEKLPPITTFGFGYDVESVLLRGIAKAGGGMYSFIPDAGMVGTSFVNSVAGNFARVPVRDIEIQVKCAGATVPTNGVLGGGEMDVSYADGVVTVRLADGGVAYSQPREFLVRLEGWTEESSVEVELKYGVPEPDRASTERMPKTLTTTVPSISEPTPEVLASYARLHFHDLIQANLPPSNLATTHALFTQLLSALPSSSPLATDLSSQVLPALSRSDWYSRWGRHYLPSLSRAHLLQTCHNFKDAGVQGYAGPEHAVFDREREKADAIFLELPPPVPTGNVYGDRGAIGRGGQQAGAPVNMRMYNNADNPCFSPDSQILLPDGTTVTCGSVKPGTLIATPSGQPARIKLIVKTLILATRTLLCKIGGMAVTPWHPIRVDGGWKFPVEVVEPRWVAADAVYSFILETVDEKEEWEPVMLIGGIEAITLGHSLLDDPILFPRSISSSQLGSFTLHNVVEHPYFGSQRVVEDLMSMPGAKTGTVVFEEGCMVRADKGDDGGSGGDALLSGFRRDKVVVEGAREVKCGA